MVTLWALTLSRRFSCGFGDRSDFYLQNRTGIGVENITVYMNTDR